VSDIHPKDELARSGRSELLDYLQDYSCPVCEMRVGSLHQAREMMLGTRDVFPYWECSECGCLSLAEVPSNLSTYYPTNYYSLQAKPTSRVRALRDSIYLSPFSFLVNWHRRADLDVIRSARLKKHETLLDVGCGNGNLLADLRGLGYDAHGIDPFVSDDLYDRFGIRVKREMLTDVQKVYDVVLFRHSLEHMPIDTLQLTRSRVKSNGLCVVCIPIVGWAWQHYRTNWSQLDAPRHLFLHSQRSFEVLAAKSGFRIEKVLFDSNEFQFWASDSYVRDVPLTVASLPKPRHIATMRRAAATLNRRQQGDTAQFYLRPI
jgi:SAM-dependent methyltransferase